MNPRGVVVFKSSKEGVLLAAIIWLSGCQQPATTPPPPPASVTAPITGRISKKAVTVGNLVTGGGTTGGGAQATLLTTIVSVDPLYCYVNIPEDAFLKYHDLGEQERRAGVQNAKVPCYLQVGT